MNVSQDVSQGVSQGVSQKKKGLVKMKKNEKMSVAIVEFILDSEFLTTYIKNGVIEKIYDEKSYNINMIEQVIENDLTAGYNGGYISDMILDEISIYPLVDKIDELYIYEFMEIAEETQKRSY